MPYGYNALPAANGTTEPAHPYPTNNLKIWQKMWHGIVTGVD